MDSAGAMQTSPVGRRVPLGAGAPDLYACPVLVDDMGPRFKAGDFLLADPAAPCGPGDEILVTLKDGRAAVLVLVDRGAGTLRGYTVGGRDLVTINEAGVETVHAIMGIAKHV